MAGFKYTLGINELSSRKHKLTNALLAEFVGIFLLNFFACAACTFGDHTMISFAFGLTVFVAVMAIGHVSGGHINPAVTVSQLVTGKISVVRALLYILLQCLGAVAGSASFKSLVPDSYHNGLGHTNLAEGLTPLQGLGLEFFLGFILIFTVFGVCDGNKPDSKYVGPLAIGLAVTVGHLGTIKYTGSSMNPARTFGTAVITQTWDNHWIYWAGPILGGIVASLLYTQAFSAPDVEVDRSEKYRTDANEKEEKYLDIKYIDDV
ncbi:aquaporin AQPAn.G isoform X1 [Contarinia nasturtii]|uniref:aquaporin AQPAn.G isoform X1 n=1 Tax=Contarinia nasturtii TaxID=265458 RepID=UPI0012D41C12|nr:aquaporin AQPAn.G isoform X1 [Contarinia nasturtii]